jgi:CheY-like chemotaxis protein
VKPQADARRLRLDVVAPPPDWHVQADRTRARQVLLNLLSNAIKYNRPQGAVSVRVERNASQVRVNIEDTGRGLDVEQQARLFVPFERLDADGGGTEGAGIGLALSKRLMELMHGQVGVRSAPGVGSLFWLEWPVAASTSQDPDDVPQRAGEGEPEAAAAALGPTLQVLCIEDNAVNLQLIEQVVARHRGVRLHCAEHPRRGIELARELRPDLILLDINLPEMDGYAVFGRLRADETTRAIPVVAISARAMPTDIARGHAVGFAAYLTKPLDIERFDEILAEHLAARRP